MEQRTGAQLVDGADAIREQVRYGAAWIKVYADFGFYPTARADRPLRSRTNFTFEELRVLVEEAHRLGKKVAAHYRRCVRRHRWPARCSTRCVRPKRRRASVVASGSSHRMPSPT